MPRKYPKKIRERAFRLYLDTGNINDVAVLMGVQRKTIAKWRKDENWDCHIRELRNKCYKRITQEILERNVHYLSAFIDELNADLRETSKTEDAARLIDWHKEGGIDISGDVLEVRRFYDKLKRDEEVIRITGIKIGEEVIEFTSTPCSFGNERWWFLCRQCGRRCYKLYRPRHRRYFACRICHQLKYRRSK